MCLYRLISMCSIQYPPQTPPYVSPSMAEASSGSLIFTSYLPCRTFPRLAWIIMLRAKSPLASNQFNKAIHATWRMELRIAIKEGFPNGGKKLFTKFHI
jgi:hypothetical protein